MINNRLETFYKKKIFNFLLKYIIFFAYALKKNYPKTYYFLKEKKIIKKFYNFIIINKKKFEDINSLNFFFKNFHKYNLKERNQIHIDITSLVNGSPKTGIQRVVYQVAKKFYLKRRNSIQLFMTSSFTYPFFRLVDKKKFFLENKIKLKNYYTPKKNDIIFLLDFNLISVITFSKIFKFYSKNKIKIVSMIYDVLPYTNPNWFNVKNYKKIYYLWISAILKSSNVIFTISETVKEKVKKYFNSKINKNTIIKSIILGGNFSKFAKIKKKNNEKISFLMVGTIEPRKGYLDIIKCFKKISKHNNVELNICGKLGWNCENIKKELLERSNQFTNINFIQSPSDQKLKNLYEHSQVLIAASYDEGFGLPIVEALSNGLHVIARDIPIFREVGKNHIYYFPNKKTKLHIYFQKWINYYQSNKLKKNKKINVESWDYTYKKISETIKKI